MTTYLLWHKQNPYPLRWTMAWRLQIDSDAEYHVLIGFSCIVSGPNEISNGQRCLPVYALRTCCTTYAETTGTSMLSAHRVIADEGECH